MTPRQHLDARDIAYVEVGNAIRMGMCPRDVSGLVDELKRWATICEFDITQAMEATVKNQNQNHEQTRQ